MNTIIRCIFVCCCLLYGLYPISYFINGATYKLLASKSSDLLANPVYTTAFYLHISLGGLALLIGWLQFNKTLRAKYLSVHKAGGKAYILAVLISGPLGLYISFFAYGGLIAGLGFGTGAIIWTIITYMGYRLATKGNIPAHKRLMTYSYAGTFAAVTFRFWLPLLKVLFGSFLAAYQTATWLSWIPNLMIAYMIIHKKKTLIFLYHKLKIKIMLKLTITIVIATLVLSHLNPQCLFYSKASHKGESLESSSLKSDSNFSQEDLDAFKTYLKKESETTSMIILENGKTIFEYGDVSEISFIASCRKSIVSMLYGKYIENGTIDLNQTIGELGIDEDDGLLALEKTATIDHILTARSGVFHEPANGGTDKNNLQERGSVQPGEYFLYNNWDFNVAGHILELKSGKSVYQELEEQLAIPLGFEDWNIKNQKKKTNKRKSRYPAHHMYISTRDMAKIGQLILNKGNWNGKQIISKAWIEKTLTTVTPTETCLKRKRKNDLSAFQFSYGYMWWLIDNFKHHPNFEGGYTARGWGGHYITVLPKVNLVIAHKCNNPFLVKWGLKSGGMDNETYYNLLFKVVTGKKDLSKALLPEERTSESSIEQFIALIKQEDLVTSAYDISENSINSLGYKFMQEKSYTKALEIFKLNIELYPNRYNVYDSYGDCLLKLDKKTQAIEAYQQSLELNPDNEGGLQILNTILVDGVMDEN